VICKIPCPSDVLDFSKVKLTRGESIRVSTDQDKEPCWINGMCLVSDDRIVAVDYNNMSVKLVDVTAGRVLHQLQLKYLPCGVCRMSGDRVAVTLPDAVTIKVSVYTFITNI